jgi:hypothetical protein
VPASISSQVLIPSPTPILSHTHASLTFRYCLYGLQIGASGSRSRQRCRRLFAPSPDASMRHTSRIEQAVGKRKKGRMLSALSRREGQQRWGGPTIRGCRRRLCLVAAGIAPWAVRSARLRGYSTVASHEAYALSHYLLCFQAISGVGESSTIHRTAVKGVCAACIQQTMAVSLQPATVPPSKGPAPHTSNRTGG